jgi:hypothetical protein
MYGLDLGRAADLLSDPLLFVNPGTLERSLRQVEEEFPEVAEKLDEEDDKLEGQFIDYGDPDDPPLDKDAKVNHVCGTAVCKRCGVPIFSRNGETTQCWPCAQGIEMTHRDANQRFEQVFAAPLSKKDYDLWRCNLTKATYTAPPKVEFKHIDPLKPLDHTRQRTLLERLQEKST